jgi:uncharacterized protein YcnI
VVGTPLAALAHVHVTPDTTAADATTTLTFSFSHGCEDSPTTALVIDIPQGVTNVVPAASASWDIQRTLAGNGTVTQVTYTAVRPIESGLKGEVAMDVRFAPDLAGTSVPFPVTQQCVSGSTAWTQGAGAGEEEPESPAPVVQVGAVAASTGDDEHGGDAQSAGDHSATDHSATGHSATDQEGASAADGADPAAATTDAAGLWLGGAGLALGAAALVVARGAAPPARVSRGVPRPAPRRASRTRDRMRRATG